MDTPPSTWTFSQSFTPQFQAMRTELELQISAAKSLSSPPPDVVNGLSVSLAKVTKALVDATGSIPAYDQKQCEAQLKSLEKSIEELRAASAPKSKFAFKRKPQAPPSSATPNTTPKTVESTPAPPPSTTSSNLVLASHTQKYLTRSDLPEHPQHTDLAIFDLDSCIVNLLAPKDSNDSGEHLIISALHARNLTKCIILLPSIRGSALLHDLSHCIIVLGSHQFRMHSSKKIDVFLSISSNPIIEHCNTIRFAQYPSSFRNSLFDNQKATPLFSVQDFSHIRATPSPHYCMMEDADKESVEERLTTARDNVTYSNEVLNILPQ